MQYLMIKIPQFLLLFIIILTVAGCESSRDFGGDYDFVLSGQKCGLVRLTERASMPDFTMGCLDTAGLATAVERSLNYLSKPSSKNYYPVCGISHSDMVETLEEFKKLLSAGMGPVDLNNEINKRFDIYMAKGSRLSGKVLFTGYFSPVIEGSRIETENFKYPLYKLPENAVKDTSAKVLGRRVSSGEIVPFAAARELEASGELSGNELVWLGSSSDVYTVSLQGGALIKLADGGEMSVGYAGSNGYDFVTGTPREANKRLVFFKEVPAQVRGSINEQLVPMRSAACSDAMFPPGGLAYMQGHMPIESADRIVNTVYSGFVLNQDSGSAFTGADKCDIYMGQGDKAGQLAKNVYGK